MANDFLLEIGTEEIPAKFMPAALEQLAGLAAAKFSEQRIGYNGIRTMGTPRRLTLLVRGIADMQDDKECRNKGPSIKIAFDADGNPTKAAIGFARGQGVEPQQLVVNDGYVYAVIQEKGCPVQALLPDLCVSIIHGLNFSKTMRWGNLDVRFVRPIRWLVALHGAETIPFSVADVTSDRYTYGHRFLSRGKLEVQSADDYLQKLADHYVMLDQAERRAVIRRQVEELAADSGGTASIDEDLLEEVVYLVEYPTALCGSFDQAYLSLPPEAVITPMREHQRYFPVIGPDGKLLPKFITVRNGGNDYIDTVRHGNERVLRARLADAKFFFEEDKKIALADRVEKLKTIVFQEGLGTLYDKTARLEALSGAIAGELDLTDEAARLIRSSAHLAKADLTTGMVCEFTELQGVMGREYALLNGADPLCAQAIFEHYQPRFAGDVLPASQAGKVISIADKMDNIVATFSRGLIPTGSQDPYALRRQAMGIVNIMLDAGYHLSLSKIVMRAMELLGIDHGKRDGLMHDILEFFRIRLKGVLSDKNIRYDIIDAVMGSDCDDIYDVWLRASAVAKQPGQALEKTIQAFTRAINLVKHASGSSVDPERFTADAEKELYQAYLDAKQVTDRLTDERDYQGILDVLARLAGPIDSFFGAVMVMVEDETVRDNRLALLRNIIQLSAKLADFRKFVI